MIGKKLFPALAEGNFKSALRMFEVGVGTDHIFLAIPKFEYGSVLLKAGKLKEAEQQFQECLTITRKTVGLGHPRAVKLCQAQCDLLWSQGRLKESWDLAEEAYEAAKKQFPLELRWRFGVTCLHGSFAGRLKKSEGAWADADAVLDMIVKSDRPLTMHECVSLCELNREVGYLPDTDKLRKRCVRLLGFSDSKLSDQCQKKLQLDFGCRLYERKLFEEAESTLREGLIGFEYPYVYAQMNLGECAWRKGKFEDAEREFRDAIVDGEKRGGNSEDLADCKACLIRFLIQRRSWTDVPKLVQRYAATPELTPLDQSWATFVRSAVAELKVVPGAKAPDLQQVERLFGESKESGIANYRSRTVLLLGGDLKREYARLNEMIRGGIGVENARDTLAAYDTALGDPAKALTYLKPVILAATASAKSRKLQLFFAYNTDRLNSDAKTQRALGDELAAVEAYLKATERFQNPALGGYAFSQILELQWWCLRMRTASTHKTLEQAPAPRPMK